MTTQVIKLIGAGGDCADLTAFGTAAPADMVAADQEWIAEFNIGELNVTTVQQLGNHTTDATRHFTIRPRAGQGIKDNVASGDPLYYNAAKGSAIHAGVSFGPVIDTFGSAFTKITGLQIKSVATATLDVIHCGPSCLVDSNIFDVLAASSVVNAGEGNSTVTNNLMIPRNAMTSVALGYSAATSVAEDNTIYAPNGANLDGSGNPVYAISAQVTGGTAKNNAIFGYTRAFNNDSYFSANSSNNATDIATLVGINNLTALVFANQFVSTTDLHLKPGSALVGAGVAVSGITTDILGHARATPPSIGAIAYATPPAATVPGAPVIGVASAGNGTASCSFTAPSSNGGAAIVNYTGTASTGEVITCTSSPGVWPTLGNGVARTFHFVANNSVGASSVSAESNSVTPSTVNVPPTFNGTIANINGNAGSGLTSVDVHTRFADSGALTYSKSGTAWPAGATLDPATAVIGGTPLTQATTAGCMVRATDTFGQFIDSNAFSFIIGAALTGGGSFNLPVAGKNIMGGLRAGVACHFTVHDKVTRDRITTISSLVTDATTGGLLFSAPGTTPGVEYLLMPISDADVKDTGIVWAVAQ